MNKYRYRPAKSLALEVIVRLSLDKFCKTKICDTPSDAVEKLFRDYLLTFMNQFNCHEFRKEYLWNEECDTVLKNYLPVLQNVYRRYSGRYTLPSHARFMSLEEFQQLMTDADLLDENFVAREIDVSFALSMMTRVDELDTKKYIEMQFIEYIEAISRGASVNEGLEDIAYNGSTPLWRKLEILLGDRFLKSCCDNNTKDTFELPISLTDDSRFILNTSRSHRSRS
eukprot:CAMPEP_0115001676 /NCGR_PEP_ID=MMETSP0216-20121206/17531_1 /TAXON_ID=223996 /ORGANISM="Protocruzia adherens, Strain Boccale" /LENGTH=225 /DNA_ID=CAMNT_0002367083 /DNA_START=124 /DNA_END=802 /DNA_ORIENTATION=+